MADPYFRYTEKFMAELAHKSMKMWKELERDAGTALRSMTGLLNFGDPTMGNDTPEGRSISNSGFLHSRIQANNSSLQDLWRALSAT